MSNEFSSESRQRNTGTSNERFFITSTSRKSLIDDLNDLRELYAFSLSEIQVGKKKEDEEEEEMILRMKEKIDDVSDETRCLFDCSIFCRLYSSHFVLTLRYSLYLWKVLTLRQFTFIHVLLLHVVIAELTSSNDTLHQRSSCQEREPRINCANAESEVISNDWSCRDQMSEVLCRAESIREVDSRSRRDEKYSEAELWSL